MSTTPSPDATGVGKGAHQLQRMTTTPTSLACMLARTEVISLRGFKVEKKPLSLIGIRLVAPNSTNAELLGQLKAGQQLNARVRIASVVIASIGMALLGLALIYRPSTVATPVNSNLIWSVTQVTSNGVYIRSSAGDLLVPVGGNLPNGSPLLGVNPADGTYSTQNETIRINRRAPL